MSDSDVRTVLKVGGSLLARPSALERVVRTVAAAARDGARLVVVPGGGPFADAVRVIDRRVGLGDDAAHWMAVLAMDQHAHLLADRIPRARLVEDRAAAEQATRDRVLPVLAPYRWLRAADPLPHSWAVTADSVAAWVAGALGAPRLVLVKPVAGGPELVDERFSRALPSGIDVTIVAADDLTTDLLAR